MNIRIRSALPDEAAFLSGLALRSKAVWGYSDEFMRRCEPLLAVSPDYIRVQPVYVAEVAGIVRGFYSLNAAKYQVELDLLFVEPDMLQKGIGRALMTHALRTAGALGYASVYVESDPGAEAFYLRFGARRIGSVASTVEVNRVLPLLLFEMAA